MANPDWFDFEPADRESEAMFAFILETCQDIKGWAYDRIVEEGRKPGPTPKEVRREQWLEDYFRINPSALDIPRYALRSALEVVLEYGKKKNPRKATAWNKFQVDPRKGWRKEANRDKVVSWDDWLKGKEASSYEQRVTKDKTAMLLFEKGLLHFRWGRLEFNKTNLRRLAQVAVENDWSLEELIHHIKQINFRRWRDRWQVNFDFME